MFWRVAGLATTSPVETVLDKESFTLEDLLDEDDLIQEVKSMNGRLVSYLRNRPQVEQLLKYVVEEPPPDADDKRLFKYPFVSCEVFTCEIDAIFNTLLESEELMDLLFSFATPDRPHGALLSGYFCKVVICLLVRRTHDVMRYLQNHRDYLKKLVDLIGITSIMEVVMRLVGADEQILMFHADAVQWLADTDLLEMLVEKLDPQQSPDVHTNTADTLSAVARTAPSALASQLASPDYISKLFKHVLSSPQSKSSLINALSVCITLLDPKRISAAAAAGQARGIQNLQPGTGGLIAAAPETVDGMLQQLGDLLKLLAVKGDERVLPTTYGQLSPPLGIHRLKIVEFIAVLVRTGSVPAAEELVRLMAINTVLDLFFDFPFNNLVHHQVESIVNSCLEASNPALLDHLLKDCKLVSRILSADADPHAPDTTPTGTPKTSSRGPSRAGYMGHLTRMANKLIALSPTNDAIRGALEGEAGWNEWHQNVLQKRNSVENVFQWSCGRPTAVEDRTSEPVTDGESEFLDPQRDFDLPQGSMANNIGRDRFSNRYGVFDGEVEEQDVFFDDETAEVVISSLHLGGDDSSDEDEGEATSSKRSPEGAEVIDSDSDEEEVSPKVPRGGFRFPKPTALEVEGGGESSGGGGSDDEVVLGDEDMLPGSPTAPVDLSEAAAAAAAGKLGTAGVIAEGSGKLSEAALAKEATQDVDLFGDASPFRATQPANPPAATAPKNFFAPAGSAPGGFNDFNAFATDFAANFSDSPAPASSPTPSKPPSRGFGSPESFGSPDSFESPNHSFPAFPINPARNIDLFADETPFMAGGPSAFSAVPPKTAHEKAQPLDTNLFAPAGGDVGVSQGPPLNDLFAKGGPASPPVDLFAAAQATPNAEEAHSAVQQGTATEIGWFKDDASRAPGGSETPGSDTPEEGRFSSDSLEKPTKEGSEEAEPERRGLYSADSLDKATEAGLEKAEAEGGAREKSGSGGEKTMERPGGKVGPEHDGREVDKHAKLDADTSELGHGGGTGEGLEDPHASPEVSSEKRAKPDSGGALGGLAALGAAAVGGVGAIGASLGHAFSKQDPNEKPAEGVESESRMEVVDKNQRSLEAPSTSLQTPAHGVHAPFGGIHSKGVFPTNEIGGGEAPGGKSGAEDSASTKQIHAGAAEKSEFNDVNFWKSSYGMSIDEDAL